MIVTLPLRFPVTRPLEETVAMLPLELDQEKVWFGTAFPVLSSAVAVSCIVEPSFRFLDGPVRTTLATGPGVTVMVAVAFTPATVAVIVAAPAFDVDTFAVSFPVEFSDAIWASDDVQVTALLVTELPFASFTVAVSGTTWPAVTLELEGLIAIEVM